MTTETRAQFVLESDLGETIHRGRAAGAMPVLVVRKPGFSRRNATLTVSYGSIDLEFTPPNESRPIRTPAGIAHFLEHKMFEKRDGDVTEKLAALGASTNAMTGFDATTYLVETAGDIEEPIEILVDFVTTPYFTPELVEKEKGIIIEEIRMYRDDPGWRAYTAVLEGLYGKHPLAVDIAGTEASVSAITAEHLNLVHRSFYRPASMLLAVAGDVRPERVRAIAESVLQRNCPDAPGRAPRRRLPSVTAQIHRRQRRLRMPVATPKLYVGWKATSAGLRRQTPIDLEIGLEVALGVLLGRGGALHRHLYELGLIDDSFTYWVTAEREFAFVIAGGDTPDPKALERELTAGIDAALRRPFDRSDLRRVRRGLYGSFARSLDSVESICSNVAECELKGASFFTYGRRLSRASDESVRAAAGRVLARGRWASVQIGAPARRRRSH